MCKKLDDLYDEFISLNENMISLTARQVVVYKIIAGIELLMELIDTESPLREFDDKYSEVLSEFNQAHSNYLEIEIETSKISRELKWSFYNLTRIVTLCNQILDGDEYEELSFYHLLIEFSNIMKHYLTAADDL